MNHIRFLDLYPRFTFLLSIKFNKHLIAGKVKLIQMHPTAVISNLPLRALHKIP